jgi:hypothetical protein
MDNIFTIKQIIEKQNRWAEEVLTAFIDLAKAYDSVHVNRLWEEMEKIGVRGVLVKAMKKLYENNCI